jgi:hypothetical protein
MAVIKNLVQDVIEQTSKRRRIITQQVGSECHQRPDHTPHLRRTRLKWRLSKDVALHIRHEQQF